MAIKKTTFINAELEYYISNFSGIYKITNVKNKKFYIGSAKNLYKRANWHINDLVKNKHKNPHLQNSYNKYGNVFTFEIIKLCNDNDLFEIEQYYLDTLNPEYNINKSATGRKGPLREETKQKIAKSQHKEVEQYDEFGILINTFNSLNEVFAFFNMKKSGGLSTHLKGKQRVFKNYFWCYKGEKPTIRKKSNRWQKKII